jgi:hypothetical protein
MADRPTIVVVGGFLGAGKTTLILAAAKELARRGLKSAVILNDQGDSLVDTQLARKNGLSADEVTGGCFCCRFSLLMEAAGKLRIQSPAVIFAEPVGSCADISYTVLRPLREVYSYRYRLAPFTVCVDPARVNELELRGSNPALSFLFRNQLAEADLVCYTKADLYPYDEVPNAVENARYVSAQTGQGVVEWLDEILLGQIPAGARTLDIDYSEYARAEAALAWLNLSAVIECAPAVSPSLLLGPLMDRLAASVEIVHLKATDHSDSGFLKVAMANSRDEPRLEGELDASPAVKHEILVNLRAVGPPEPVRAVVEEWMAELSARVLQQQIACFTPAPPRRPLR